MEEGRKGPTGSCGGGQADVVRSGGYDECTRRVMVIDAILNFVDGEATSVGPVAHVVVSLTGTVLAHQDHVLIKTETLARNSDDKVMKASPDLVESVSGVHQRKLDMVLVVEFTDMDLLAVVDIEILPMLDSCRRASLGFSVCGIGARRCRR